MKRIEDSLRDLWDNIQHTNIQITGVPEEEKKKGSEKIFEDIIVENFPNMGKEILGQVQEAQRVPYRINPRKNTPRHIVIKLTKIKEKRMKTIEGGLRDLWETLNTPTFELQGSQKKRKTKGRRKYLKRL